jgi:hypothetical protein
MASAAKHVLNDPATLVVDSLKGLATLNPDIKLDEAARGTSILKAWDQRADLSDLPKERVPSSSPLRRWIRP